MGLLILKSDFTGKFAIAQNDFSKLDLFIDKYEKEYLIDLLGSALYNLFEADLDSQTPKQPQSLIYQDIYNPFHYDEGDCIIRSEGMREMLKGFLYFEFVREQKYKNTDTGVFVHSNETTREVGFTELNIYGRYNESLRTYRAIQAFICKNNTDYPDYNGQIKGISHWSI